MVEPVKRGAGYEDLLNLPDNIVGEVLGGELVTHPRPAPRHARAASLLGALIGVRFDHKLTGDDNGWWIVDELECHFGEDIVVPDIAGWRKSTMPELPDPELHDKAWFDTAPNWVCEVLSPATSKYDRGIKRDIYARQHVSHYWIVDPSDKSIEVFALNDGRWTLVTTAQDNQHVSLVPFESMPFDLSTLWA